MSKRKPKPKKPAKAKAKVKPKAAKKPPSERADDKAKESPKFPDDGNGKSIAETQAENKKSEPASKPKRSRKKSK